MISQLLIVWPVVAIVLGKAATFHHGLNGCRADGTKWTLLDFSFSLLEKKWKEEEEVKRQKIVAVEDLESEIEVVLVEDNGLEAEDV